MAHLKTMASDFHPARLKVYGKALDALVAVETVTQGIPRRWWPIADQLRRATLSIGGNIAEGAMEFSRAEQQRIFRLARRSAGECLFYMAGIRRLRFAVAEAERYETLLLEIIRMLTPMIIRGR